MALQEPDLPALGRRLAAGVRARLVRDMSAAAGQETLVDAGDLKSAHRIDVHAADVAREVLRGARCNLFIEGEAAVRHDAPRFCVYIDPIDGSLNWDRGVGDPAVVLAAGRGAEANTLADLETAYVEGLRSGDRYWVADGAALHRNALTGARVALRCRGPGGLERATGYLRCGYGGARRQLERTLPLFLAARDVRAVDNAASEIAEIARGAADFMVEARGISDGYNLLAWPILRAAGGALLDLDGAALDTAPFDPAAPVDFVAASDRRLADEVVARVREQGPAAREAVGRVARAAGPAGDPGDG